MTEYCHYYQVVQTAPQKRHSERKSPTIARFRCGGFRGRTRRKIANRPRSPSRLRYQLRINTLCNASALGAPRRAGFDLLRSEALPLRSPTTPRKRCPLARGFALTANRSLRGLFFGSSARFVCGFAREGSRFTPRAPARRSPPGAAPRCKRSCLFPASAAVARGAASTRPCRFRRLRYGSGFIKPRDPPAPLSSTSY